MNCIPTKNWEFYLPYSLENKTILYHFWMKKNSSSTRGRLIGRGRLISIFWGFAENRGNKMSPKISYQHAFMQCLARCYVVTVYVTRLIKEVVQYQRSSYKKISMSIFPSYIRGRLNIKVVLFSRLYGSVLYVYWQLSLVRELSYSKTLATCS